MKLFLQKHKESRTYFILLVVVSLTIALLACNIPIEMMSTGDSEDDQASSDRLETSIVKSLYLCLAIQSWAPTAPSVIPGTNTGTSRLWAW